MKTLTHRLAEYASSWDFSVLPSSVVHEAKKRILDSLACAYGAQESPPLKAARSLGSRFPLSSGATLLGTRIHTTPDFAAFANGALIRYLDYNDTYLSKEPAHPSDNLAAALAIAESERADGKSLISALVLGYEIQCRLCDAASLRTRGWDHVVYVSLASSALSSRLMRLGRKETAHAIALSIAPNIALRQTRVGELSMWKGCAAANAARNGLFAALLAREGITGPAPIFEGEKGFFHQVTGYFDLDPENFGGKKNGFKISDTYIKYYPSEYHSQAAVEAALELRKEIPWKEIEHINVETYDACVDIIAGEKEKWHPKTRETADHSLPYCIAVALMEGEVGLKQFSEERIADAHLRNLTQRVQVSRNTDHTREYPKSFPCRIEITTRDGKTFSREVRYPKGHPQNPLTDEEVERKFEELSRGLLSRNQREQIIAAVWRLEDVEEVGKFMELLAVEHWL